MERYGFYIIIYNMFSGKQCVNHEDQGWREGGLSIGQLVTQTKFMTFCAIENCLLLNT